MQKPKKLSIAPGTTKQMNQLLSPIFDVVRKNKINSYFQFRKLSLDSTQLDKKESSHYIFTPTLKVNKKIEIPNTREMESNQGTLQKKMMAKTFYPTKTANKQHTKRMNATAYATLDRKSGTKTPNSPFTQRNNTSKVKKHLVESIDFEEIQKLLYKKRDCITRYQYFYEKLKNNRMKRNSNLEQFSDPLQEDDTPQQLKQKPKNNFKTISYKINNLNNLRQFTPEAVAQPSSKSFRTTPKKKFWVRENISAKTSPRKTKNDNPEINQLIQGKSFRSFSPQKQEQTTNK